MPFWKSGDGSWTRFGYLNTSKYPANIINLWHLFHAIKLDRIAYQPIIDFINTLESVP
jgi:hypothetical protein